MKSSEKRIKDEQARKRWEVNSWEIYTKYRAVQFAGRAWYIQMSASELFGAHVVIPNTKAKGR